MTGASPPTLVLDACLVITFGNAGRLDLVTDLTRYRVTVSSRATREVTRPPAHDALWQALDDGGIRSVSVDLSVPEEQDALARFDAMPAFRGRGDAEVLALAVARGYAIGTDERVIRRIVLSELAPSRLVSTLDVIVLAVREGRLSARDGRRLLGALDVGPTYLGRLEAEGRTLADLI
jgi:hypothetical protein